MSSISALNSLLSSASSTSGIDLSSLLQAASGASTAGIDVTAAVNAAVTAAQAPENAWESQETTLQSQSTALTQLQTDAANLGNDMQSLNSLTSPLSARTVTSSNSSIISGSATSGSASGNHTVMVNALAQTASWASNAIPAGSTSLPSESFTITDANGTATITTGNGINTLSALAAEINGNTTLGVTANVITDANGSRLAIVSNTSGSASNFIVTASPTTTSSWSSQPIATSTTPLNGGTFTVTGAGGQPTTFTVHAGDTLSTLVNEINTQVPGVTASIGSASGASYLQLASAAGYGNFSISNDPVGPSLNFASAVSGANASLTVDGINISSASNTVAGALPGVTMNLLNASPGVNVSLAVAPDTTQASTAINQFVTDYNQAIKDVNTQFTNTGSGEGVLATDSVVRSLQTTLENAVNYINSPPSGTTTVSNLSSLGISVGDDGTLTVDSSALTSALQNNFSDVQNFFQGSTLNGFANSLDQQLSNFTDLTDGAFTLDLQSINTESSGLQTDISNFETNYITPLKAQLQSEYSSAEIALQQLPTEIQQINTELGLNNNSSKG
jgi:flagellar hook-associated protein 2